MKLQIILILIFISSWLKGQDGSIRINIISCIDGISRLHLKTNQIWWEHIRYFPPGEHEQCRNLTLINNNLWRDWTAYFQLEHNLDEKKDVLITVNDCPNKFFIVQRPDSTNYWETIIELDDSILPGPHVYNLDILIGRYVDPSYDLTFDTTNRITLNNIFFNVNEYSLLPESYFELDKAYNSLLKVETSFIISGHTDISGDSISNQKLSKARAKAVYDYFIKRGIPEERMEYVGYGDVKPIDTNDTESGRKNNRRVEIELIE